MSKEKNIEALIRTVVGEMEEVHEKYKSKLEHLAEEGRTTIYIGDYGNGETYYSQGYIEDQKASDRPDGVVAYYFSSNSEFEAGSWISSSEMC